MWDVYIQVPPNLDTWGQNAEPLGYCLILPNNSWSVSQITWYSIEEGTWIPLFCYWAIPSLPRTDINPTGEKIKRRVWVSARGWLCKLESRTLSGKAEKLDSLHFPSLLREVLSCSRGEPCLPAYILCKGRVFRVLSLSSSASLSGILLPEFNENLWTFWFWEIAFFNNKSILGSSVLGGFSTEFKTFHSNENSFIWLTSRIILGNRKVTSNPLLLLFIKKDNIKESPTNRSAIKRLYIDLRGYYVIFFCIREKRLFWMHLNKSILLLFGLREFESISYSVIISFKK